MGSENKGESGDEGFGSHPGPGNRRWGRRWKVRECQDPTFLEVGDRLELESEGRSGKIFCRVLRPGGAPFTFEGQLERAQRAITGTYSHFRFSIRQQRDERPFGRCLHGETIPVGGRPKAGTWIADEDDG